MPRRKTTIDRNPLETLPIDGTRSRDAGAADIDTSGRRVLAAWTHGTDAILAAMLEAQNAVLAVSESVLDATFQINRAALADSADLFHRAQEATRALLFADEVRD